MQENSTNRFAVPFVFYIQSDQTHSIVKKRKTAKFRLKHTMFLKLVTRENSWTW